MKKYYLILLFSSFFAFSQCPYPAANLQLGAIRTLCVGTDRATTTNLSINNVNSTNFVAFNVVQGFSYRFIIAADVYPSDNETINIYEFSANTPLANATGTAGATLNWTATFSGQIKVILSQGACLQTSTANTTLLSHVISVGNTLDSQTTFGTNTWIGHVYDYPGGGSPGGASPALPPNTTPFTNAEYVGNFAVPTQNFVQGYGGNDVCFPVLSGGTIRTNIQTQTFAVRYRMNSTLPAGCYIITLRGDDGIRIYIDNQLVFDRWIEQAPTNYSNVLVYLDGNADVIFDYYENSGQNETEISIAPFDPATNSIAPPTPAAVCSGSTTSALNATSYVYNGGAVNPTINYQWQVSPDNVTFTDIAGASNEDYTPPAITTAVQVIRYYRRVLRAAAVSASSCEFNSNSVMVTTNPTTLSAPGATAGTGATCNSIVANWNAVAGVTNYTLDVSTDSGFATFVGTYNNLNVGTVTSIVVTGLNANTTYYYRVRAIAACGSSSASTRITYATLLNVAAAPNPAAAVVGCGQFTITWPAVANATNYQMDLSTVSNFASFIPGYQNFNLGNLTTYTSTGLTNEVVYYRMRAIGPCNTSGQSGTTTINLGKTTWNGTTWSNGVPTLTTEAIINGAYTTSANGNLDACRVIVGAAGNLTISPATFVTIQNELQNGGAVTVENNGSLVQINNSGVNTGNIAVRRTANGVVAGQDYVYWSAPVTGQNIGTLFAASPLRYSWGATATNANGGQGNWLYYSGAMNIGNGYIIRDINNATFTGLPHNGIINVPIFRGTDFTTPGTQGISRMATDDNWNLVGNPYPSAIGVNEFLTTNTAIEGFVKIWTHGTPPNSAVDPFYQDFVYNYDVNDYLTFNLLGTTSGPASNMIASGQGFMTLMVAGAAGSGTVTFNNAMRGKSFDNTKFYRSANSTPTTSRIWLDFVSASQTNRILVGYDEQATNGVDRLYDAFTDYVPSQHFYSIIDNNPYIIQGRALPFVDTDIIPLGIKAALASNYTIAIATVDGLFENNGQTIYLEDKLLDVVHNLSSSPYSFASAVGVHNDRFVIRYTDRLLSTSNFDLVNEGVNIFSSNDGIAINSTLSAVKSYEIFNVVGQQLAASKNINSNQHIVRSLNKTNQTLLVKATLENGQTVTKKLIF